jgi:hypothetical protein
MSGLLAQLQRRISFTLISISVRRVSPQARGTEAIGILRAQFSGGLAVQLDFLAPAAVLLRAAIERCAARFASLACRGTPIALRSHGLLDRAPTSGCHRIPPGIRA